MMRVRGLHGAVGRLHREMTQHLHCVINCSYWCYLHGVVGVGRGVGGRGVDGRGGGSRGGPFVACRGGGGGRGTYGASHGVVGSGHVGVVGGVVGGVVVGMVQHLLGPQEVPCNAWGNPPQGVDGGEEPQHMQKGAYVASSRGGGGGPRGVVGDMGGAVGVCVGGSVVGGAVGGGGGGGDVGGVDGGGDVDVVVGVVGGVVAAHLAPRPLESSHHLVGFVAVGVEKIGWGCNNPPRLDILERIVY